jgi:hypothetical protein
MTHRSYNTSTIPNITGDGLQSASTRIVIECGMSNPRDTPTASSVLQFSEVIVSYAERKIVPALYDASYLT